MLARTWLVQYLQVLLGGALIFGLLPIPAMASAGAMPMHSQMAMDQVRAVAVAVEDKATQHAPMPCCPDALGQFSAACCLVVPQVADVEVHGGSERVSSPPLMTWSTPTALASPPPRI